jgi:hypothetical protein
MVIFVLLAEKKSLVYGHSRIWLFFWFCWFKIKVLDITIPIMLVEEKSLGWLLWLCWLARKAPPPLSCSAKYSAHREQEATRISLLLHLHMLSLL